MSDTFPLWDRAAPGALGVEAKDVPTITVFPARAGAGPRPAMVVLPGGGFNHLAAHEGPGYAEWLSENGFASFVVKYRLATDGYRLPSMLADVARAARWVRAHAAEYQVDPGSVGMIGSSAGGYLTALQATHGGDGDQQAADPVERHSARLSLGVLCYALLSLELLAPTSDLLENLLGPNPSPEQVAAASPVQRVSPSTPPCFLWHTSEDQRVDVNHSLLFAGALHRCGVPFEMHIYEKGRHGLGLANGHPWTAECIRWLKARFEQA